MGEPIAREVQACYARGGEARLLAVARSGAPQKRMPQKRIDTP